MRKLILINTVWTKLNELCIILLKSELTLPLYSLSLPHVKVNIKG